MRQDFYRVLGVAPSASMDEIRQAFRMLARQYHPDANANDPDAVQLFKVINEAYSVLGTPQLRAAYDRAQRIGRPGASHPSASVNDPLRRGRAQTARPVAALGDEWSDLDSSEDTAPRQAVRDARGAAQDRRSPALALRLTPGTPQLAPLEAVTRFYLLSELGSAREDGVLSPPPLDLALAIDRSNSMKGAKLFETKRALQALLDDLRPDDLLTLVLFDDRAEVIADGETVSGRPGIEMALSRVVVRGSTHISEGLDATLQRLATRQNRARVASLVLLTDGLTYGDDQRCLELAAAAREMGVSITALGLGTEWNRDLLDRLAAISGGSSHFIEKPSTIRDEFEQVVRRLRATLAADMRLTLEPAEGVRVARATRVAPDIAEAFTLDTDAEASAAPGEPVAVELGALVGRADVESAVVLWELLLDPACAKPQNNSYALGTLRGTYWSPGQGTGHWDSVEVDAVVPATVVKDAAPLHQDVRLALELVTAFRLQTRADSFAQNGQVTEAAARLHTSALRLRAAGDEEHASQALHAAQQVSSALEEGKSTTLRVKYEVKNLSMFHRLRRKLGR